jgi:hypothetical protein
MKITLPLVSPSFDDERITEDLQKDFDKGCKIFVFTDEPDWKADDSSHAFSVWVEYGIDEENTLMFYTNLDDLEMFANAISKSVEMLRRDYKEVISEKIKKGSPL